MDGDYGVYWYYVRSICVPVKCKSCTCEMQHVSQGLTNYEWYKDYYCPTCKKTVVIKDKESSSKRSQYNIGVKY